MNPTHVEDDRCLMAPLSEPPCRELFPSHQCMDPKDHPGDTHRCPCGYEWVEKKLPRVQSHGLTVRRWAMRVAVLLVCATGIGAYFSATGELARQTEESAAMHRALLCFGLDCRYTPRDRTLRCVCAAPDCQIPLHTTPTREDQ